ncbi:hypothetical protein PIB30_081902 [Stylosanthes scabra]|uniref:Secreted protein n=1 Tax=Stylosanthes scabra TaxID=79078 RepID=A0ABU6RRN2_9FABA|nr:hypothetical protein [Stylosanthes scabra]
MLSPPNVLWRGSWIRPLTRAFVFVVLLLCCAPCRAHSLLLPPLLHRSFVDSLSVQHNRIGTKMRSLQLRILLMLMALTVMVCSMPSSPRMDA